MTTIGLKDLIIVDTPDALLVADKDRAQDVSKVVAKLKLSNRKEQEQHLRNFRPWGYFEPLNIGPRFQVKLLHVKPGGKLSMQMHHHRSEHWIVVQGTAKVVIGDIERLVRENESVYIFATQWHRLENPGKVPVKIIEVQIGSYLGEETSSAQMISITGQRTRRNRKRDGWRFRCRHAPALSCSRFRCRHAPALSCSRFRCRHAPALSCSRFRCRHGTRALLLALQVPTCTRAGALWMPVLRLARLRRQAASG